MNPQGNFWKGFQELMAQLQPDNQQRPGTAPTNAATNTFAQAPANNFGSLLESFKPQQQQAVDYNTMNQWGMGQGQPANTLPPGSYAAQIQNFTNR